MIEIGRVGRFLHTLLGVGQLLGQVFLFLRRVCGGAFQAFQLGADAVRLLGKLLLGLSGFLQHFGLFVVFLVQHIQLALQGGLLGGQRLQAVGAGLVLGFNLFQLRLIYGQLGVDVFDFCPVLRFAVKGKLCGDCTRGHGLVSFLRGTPAENLRIFTYKNY